ncbi:DUF3099 domain-containing protein [Corynebacterium ulcerans]|uniref:DUF3099 domain-containing protein n=1 Tax=Corynebacterium ulcerans TaxID=65058 RepID=UPI0005FEB17C|nr:DUF3099 domain-containing protein [Corynebacterium ulcerans]AKA96834.1 Hypothetical protein CUL131002_1309 [Corynebacterium ulcerans]
MQQRQGDHSEHNLADTEVAELKLSRKTRVLRRFMGHRVELVTDAKKSPSEDRHHREVVYSWIQGLRIPFLLAAMAAYIWMHNMVLSVILFIICVPLPWIAVVIANGVGEKRDPRAPTVYKPAAAREQQRYLNNAHNDQQQLSAPSATTNPPMVIDADDTDDNVSQNPT